MIVAAALLASAAELRGGNSNVTWRSLRGGQRRSRQRRIAVMSPALASSMAFLMIASASWSSRASIASVVLLRAPLGLPAGLPEIPGSQAGLPGRRGLADCFRPEFSISMITIHHSLHLLGDTT